MDQTFRDALNLTLTLEGGFVNDPLGGPTKWGITQTTLNQFTSQNHLPRLSVEHELTEELAEAIYYICYWLPPKCNEIAALSHELAMLVFDFAVNSGYGEAVKVLQSCLGLVTDGEVGDLTLAAIEKQRSTMLLNHYLDSRVAFIQALHDPRDLPGWLNRLAILRTKLVHA